MRLLRTVGWESILTHLIFLNSFYLFMDYIENTLFATSCDAFANMKVSFCDGAHGT
jgi:hypothetical protein